MVLSICPQDTNRSEAEWKFNGGQRTEAYLIIVADAADIVCGAKNFMWTPHCAILHHINKLFVMWSYWWLLHMKNFQWTPSSHDLRLLMFWRKINFVAIYFYNFTFAGAGAGDRFFSKTSTPQYFGCWSQWNWIKIHTQWILFTLNFNYHTWRISYLLLKKYFKNVFRSESWRKFSFDIRESFQQSFDWWDFTCTFALSGSQSGGSNIKFRFSLSLPAFVRGDFLAVQVVFSSYEFSWRRVSQQEKDKKMSSVPAPAAWESAELLSCCQTLPSLPDLTHLQCCLFSIASSSSHFSNPQSQSLPLRKTLLLWWLGGKVAKLRYCHRCKFVNHWNICGFIIHL